MSSSAQKLHDAILTNSSDFSLFEGLLTGKIDPNRSPTIPRIAELKNDSDNIPKDTKIAIKGSAEWRVTPLHVAVINCYHSAKSYDEYEHNATLNIIRYLILAGAKTDTTSNKVCVCNIKGFNWKNTRNMTPIALAVCLKQHVYDDFAEVQTDVLNSAIEIIQSQTGASTGGRGNAHPSPSNVDTGTSTWKSLLFIEDFSDVHFVCKDDGTTLHAHKCILAASSSYFSAYFKGPWAAEHTDGVWETSNSSAIMSVVLTYIYTGKVDDYVIQEDPGTMLSVSSEYDLPFLKKLSEDICVRKLDEDNVKEMLRLAHLHGLVELKQLCFDLVKLNAADILVDPDFMSLASEDQELWNEMTAAIGSAKKKKKLEKEREKRTHEEVENDGETEDGAHRRSRRLNRGDD